VVDPRFTRSAAVADFYAPMRTGTDIAFLGGVINYLLTHDKIQHEYVKAYTDATFLVREDFRFEDGIFSGYDAEKRSYDKSTWNYQIGDDGFVKVDETLQHPRCVLNLMNAHYSRYTPEVVRNICGTPEELFLKVCETIASTAVPNRTLTSMYALGWTQHSTGSQMIRTAAMMQTLLGNIGMAGGGMNALRGHSNIQGLTDLGLLSTLLPGYLGVPSEKDSTLRAYLAKRTLKPLRPNQILYWQNYPKFFVSLQKAWFGPAATPRERLGLRLLAQVRRGIRRAAGVRADAPEQDERLYLPGLQPAQRLPQQGQDRRGAGQAQVPGGLDPLATETSAFWQNHGEFNNVDPSKIQTGVFRLPSTCFAEEDGSLTNSGRWLQWHWKAAPPPGDAKPDGEIIAGIFTRLRALYAKDGGAFPDPLLKLTWNYKIPHAPSPDELVREYSGYALSDLADPKDTTKVLVKAGQQLDGFAELKDDGTTACGCWIYSGAWTEKGNLMARRDNSDPRAAALERRRLPPRSSLENGAAVYRDGCGGLRTPG
jgi:formate dehydrogenase major subunit